jgi:transcriptional regulator
MYIPKFNEENDQARIVDFIHKNSFGILVSAHNDIPFATHIPMALEMGENDTQILRGHVARANPHWQLWQQPVPALVIFSSAHAYISSSWYEQTTVSTWNYLAVHVYGTIQIVDDETLYESLRKLTNKYENAQEKPLYFEELGENEIRKMMRAIVGFEITIDRIEAKAKLSQNRNDADYKNIVQQLNKTDDFQAYEIAQEMAQRRPLNDENVNQ